MHQQAAAIHPVAGLSTDRRAAFINRTYWHLFAAILGFVGIQMYLFESGWAEVIARTMLQGSWLLVLGGFMVVGWIATHVSMRTESRPLQYLALGGFVLAEALIFVPLLYIAQSVAPGVIESAATLTFLGAGGLTAVAFITRKDFSFLRSVLMWGGIAAIVLIVGAVIFGFQLGMFFSVAMIAFAGAAVLYDTSNILHHYPEDRHVGAALALFGSIALMFWYILQLLLHLRGD